LELTSRVEPLVANRVGSSKEYYKGKHHCTIDLLFEWIGISCMTTHNFCFISKTDITEPVKQEVNRTVILPPFSIPWHHPCS
jgi:hypothetical protein